MKHFSIFLFLCFLSGFLKAQVTITSQTFMNVPGGKVELSTLDTSGINLPQAGAAQVWDFSTAKVTGSVAGWTYAAAKSPEFPAATATRPFAQSFLGTLPQNGDEYYELNDASWNYLGRVFAETKGVFPTGPNDSIISPAQTFRNMPARARQMFPLAEGTAWESAGYTDFYALVTLMLAGWNKDTARVRQHYYDTDSIVGWGQLIMPGDKKYDVLLKKRYTSVVDSFFVRNAPIPAMILGQLGLQNGAKSESWAYEFMTPGTTDYVVRMYSPDGNRITGIFFNTNTTPTSVVKSFEQVAATIFPNPTRSEDGFTLRFVLPLEAASQVRLMDLAGRVVLTQDGVAGMDTLDIPTAHLRGGAYLLEIQDMNGAVLTTQKLMVQ